jgi:hypothetical protein
MSSKRIPNIKSLQAEIENAHVTRSLQFLLDHREILKPYSDLEGYAFSAPGPITKDLKGFEYHFNVFRKQVLQILRSHSVFIGASIVDDSAVYSDQRLRRVCPGEVRLEDYP